MYDCHAHFLPPTFSLADIEGSLRDPALSGVVVVSENLDQDLAAIQSILDHFQVQQQQNNTHLLKKLKFCIGIHPVQHGHSVTKDALDVEELLLSSLKRLETAVVGIGECGLDFSPHIVRPSYPRFNAPPSPVAVAAAATHPPHSWTEEDLKSSQRKMFQAQINLAISLSLPLNIHSRSAGHHAIQMILESNSPPSLFHAFDGKPSVALKAISHGHFFSIPPSVLHNESFQKLVSVLPLSSMLLESDSPALGPVKGERNVPGNIKVSASEIARIKSLPVEQVVEILDENALKLFRL